MKNNLNFIIQQNNLNKDFQKWKEKRYQNHKNTIDDIQQSTLFYKFKSQSPKQSSEKNFRSPKLNSNSLIQKENNGYCPTKVFRSSLNNFRKTIIKDSIKDKNHILNQFAQTQEQNWFVPYFNERDKLGRIVKDDRSDVSPKDVNIVNMLSSQNIQNSYKIIENIQKIDSTHQLALIQSNNFDEDDDNQLHSFNKDDRNKKSFSHLPFASTSNNLTSNQLEKVRSASTFYPSMNDVSQYMNKNKLNNLISGIGSQTQFSMVQLPESARQVKTTFMNIKSYQLLSLDKNENSGLQFTQKQKQQNYCINQIQQNKPNNSSIQSNSLPCSPSRYIIRLNNNSFNNDDQIVEFDRNKQMKCSQEELIKKTLSFNLKHMQARLKREKLEKEQQFQQIPFQAKVLNQKLPNSVKSSHACRVLFNHHKKVKKFNEMIEKNDPKIMDFEIDHRQQNAKVCQNAFENYKQKFSKALGFVNQNHQIKEQKKKIKKEEQRQEMLVKWGQRLDTDELEQDEDEKYRKKILNPILTKDQQQEQERLKRQQIFQEYDKYYANQMYFLEKGDNNILNQLN